MDVSTSCAQTTVMSRATFPAAARMHRPTEFAAALSGKRIARGAFFIVSAKVHTSSAINAPTPVADSVTPDTVAGLPEAQPLSDIPDTARLGLIMAKRLAHHASTRNALKRVVREAFRAQRLSLPVADYVVRLNKKIQNMTLTELKRAARLEVDAHFSKARRS